MNHLTVDQSKKLMKLGAPQNTFFFWTDSMSGWLLKITNKDYRDPRAETYSAYTLEELIEWLGADLHSINNENTQWEVWKAYDGVPFSKNGDMQEENGATLLEAVYKFAIAVKSPTDET